MSHRRRLLRAILLGICLITITAVWRPVLARDDSNREPHTLRELIDATVEEVQVFSNVDASEPAKPLVALRWANNTRGSGSEDGMTVLYVHAGRPLAAACIYPWSGNLVHDFEAISRHTVVARRNGAIVWQPRTTGVEFADIPNAPVPETTRAQRLRQMKTLAGQFQSTLLGWKNDDSDRETLRLLPHPLYRYEPEGNDPVDGAVFAFVLGTDPETLLLLEAAKKGDQLKWQYAFARRTSGELDGRHLGTVVWTAARNPETRNPTKPHFSLARPLPPELANRAVAE